MKNAIFTLCFLCIVLSGISQNFSNDSIKSSAISTSNQIIEPINVYYDNFNNKFVVINNTKQNQIFIFSIYNITGICIKEIRCETESLKDIEIPFELFSGIYIINISNNSLKFTKKFIVR